MQGAYKIIGGAEEARRSLKSLEMIPRTPQKNGPSKAAAFPVTRTLGDQKVAR